MKLRLKLLLSLIYRLWNFRKLKKYKKYESALEGALIKKEKEKIVREVNQEVLKVRIQKHMLKFLHVNARSRFIPHPVKSNEVCRKEIYKEFGAEMLKYGVSLKPDLTFVCSTL